MQDRLNLFSLAGHRQIKITGKANWAFSHADSTKSNSDNVLAEVELCE
jgi:hypothetical protein